MITETQIEAEGGATAGNAGASQETPSQNDKLLKTVEGLSQKLEENSQVLKTIRLRDQELRNHPHSQPVKDDPAEEEKDLAELKEIMEKPPEEAAKLLSKRSKKERETFNKMLKQKEAEIVNSVSSKIKTDMHVDAQVQKAKEAILKDFPHLAKHYEEIGLKAAKIFNGSADMSIYDSMQQAAKEFHNSMLEFHETETKKKNPNAPISSGSVSETAGKPNKARAPEPAAKSPPKTLNEYYDREQERRAMKNQIKI